MHCNAIINTNLKPRMASVKRFLLPFSLGLSIFIHMVAVGYKGCIVMGHFLFDYEWYLYKNKSDNRNTIHVKGKEFQDYVLKVAQYL